MKKTKIFTYLYRKLFIMGCACKGNSGQNAQMTQVRKRPTVSGNVVNRAMSNNTRKQIVIRRPAR